MKSSEFDKTERSQNDSVVADHNAFGETTEAFAIATNELQATNDDEEDKS